MMDALTIAAWIVGAVVTAPIWCALLWEIWVGTIRPRLIARDRIDALAEEMLARYGERAAEKAWIAEDRAWRYSDGFEQGVWRRVRSRLQSMRRER